MENSAASNALGFEYPRAEAGYDEVYGNQLHRQAHWQHLLDGLQALGDNGIQERHLKAERILRDDGASYNGALNGGFSGKSRAAPLANTWQLDPVPLLLASEEWATIESGLLERSELFNLLLKDLYGERTLIRHGVIPPELVFGHSGFLRAAQGLMLPGEHQLVLHATDMVRASNGTMHVIADRTQSPSGAGYALENRTVMSRVLPSLFRDSHVHRLALFFRTLRSKLNSLASRLTAEQPRVVILTPGSYSETYFEHAYLANYLGYPLVQGSDLRVSKGYLWMRSLGEMTRVDVVLRRIDDSFADPVELKSDSSLGVPGLLEVARSGRVVIANPLGSGVLENPALLRYLPQIGSHFLGREPRLPSAKTYWCGDPQDLAYVLDHLPQLVLKPDFRKPGAHSVFGSQLDRRQQALLKEQVRQAPLHFAAQEYIQPSTSPSWNRQQLTPLPTILRGFAVADESSYRIMPGGLTRVGGGLSLTNQQGAVSKDTWIIASEPEKQVSLLEARPLQRLAVQESKAAFPCRVVENLYWVGRYAERAESVLRLLRTVFMHFNSTYHMPQSTRHLLLRSVTELTSTYPGFTLADPELYQHPEAELRAVILDAGREGSVSANLSALLRSTDQVRELLSTDTQRVINDIRDQVDSLEQSLNPELNAAPEEALDPLVTTLLALTGLGQESMVRGLGWRFMDMGRRIERTIQIVRLLRASLVKVLPDEEQLRVLETILMSNEALITFRRRYHAGNDVAHGLELLLCDNTNPRSVFYQIELLRQHLARLPSRGTTLVGLTEEERLLLEASTAIQLCRTETLVLEEADSGNRAELDQLLARLQLLLQQTSNHISSQYFDQVKVHQQLVRTDWEEEL